ncbi:MAG: flagellin, partial [Kiloniellaceae bacterium]
MALNVISNFAANVAHRNLVISDGQASDSLAKLSSGQRVVSAKDDAASLAIGSRLKAEVVAMRTASVNAGQAGSMLQIADGALATTSDILVRMKELAVQSSSGQFSSVERGVLDSEYQALLAEITRIANDTEFNGTQLIAGGASTVTSQFASDFTTAGNGFTISVDPAKVADNSAF